MTKYMLAIDAEGVSDAGDLLEQAAKELVKQGFKAKLTEVAEPVAPSIPANEAILVMPISNLALTPAAQTVFSDKSVEKVEDAIRQGRKGLKTLGLEESDIDALAALLASYNITLPD